MANDDPVKSDSADGLPAPAVGPWARDKHALLRLYVEVTRATRAKFIGSGKAGATYIDLFCASGRAYIKGTDDFIDGSPLVAWKASQFGGATFSAVHISDSNAVWLDAAGQRLRNAGAPVVAHSGDAIEVAKRLSVLLNPNGLHFALLDPFDLDLSFELILALAALKRMDLLIHVSAMELQRNWQRYSKAATSPLDRFAPGWRDHVDLKQADERARLEFIRYWVSLLEGLGFKGELKFELIRGPNNIPLYWLVLVAKHEIATKFWSKAVRVSQPQDQFDF